MRQPSPIDHRRRGGALIMVIILTMVITSVVMVIGWTSATMVQSTGNLMKENRSYYVAEGALQRAYWLYKKSNSYRVSAATGTDVVDGLTYSYSYTVAGAANAPVLVSATASNGSVMGQVHVTLTSGGGLAATVATGGKLSSTSQLTLTGNIVSVGQIQTSGTFIINGNVDTASTFGGGTVTGTTTTNDHTITAASVPSVTAIYNSLQPTAYAISAGNISSLNFSVHPVLYANGNVSLQSPLTITGSGTLVVNGQVQTGNDVGTAGSPKTFNVVCTGNFTATNNWYVTGSIYCGGTITFNNQTVIVGVIVSTLDTILNNHHSITYAAPPSFDTRGGGLTSSKYGGVSP